MRNGRIFIILGIITIGVADASSCGPERKCHCETDNRMDCSNTNLAISTVCRFIRNQRYNISVLHLANNNYQNIMKPDLRDCHGLSRLYLRGNRIRAIQNGSLTYLDSLQLLDISNNSLALYDRFVQQNFLFPLTIRTLMLNRNSNESTSELSSYPDLSYLEDLEILYIDGLKDVMFPPTYSRILHLHSVTLSGLNGYCNIPQLTNFTFVNFPQIRTLNLSSCNIENIEAGAFESLSNLETLDLSYNLRLGFGKLRNVSYSLQFTNIKSLNYSKVYSTFVMGKQVRKQDVCYLWNTTLSELVFNSNRIQLFETNVAILMPETLNILRVEDNLFTFGPYLLQFGCISNFKELYGSYQNTPHNPLLYEMEPNENSNYSINDDNSCPFMQNNFLRNISRKHKNCPFFENDKIDIKHHWPRFPGKLEKFEFSHSNMQYSIPPFPIVPSNVSLKYIDVSGNILNSWIGPIGPFPNLKYLNLSRSYCSYIGPKFSLYLRSVESLHLQENFLGLVLSDESKGPAFF